MFNVVLDLFYQTVQAFENKYYLQYLNNPDILECTSSATVTKSSLWSEGLIVTVDHAAAIELLHPKWGAAFCTG